MVTGRHTAQECVYELVYSLQRKGGACLSVMRSVCRFGWCSHSLLYVLKLEQWCGGL